MNDNYIEEINRLFESGFKSAYKDSKVRGKSKLLAYVANFHRQWYYSALIEGTILSPANLNSRLGSSGEHSSFTIPAVCLRKSGNNFNISFSPLSYSLESHPIVDDFKVFLSCITPDVLLDENDFIVREVESEILRRVSIYDPFYIEYMLLLAIHLDLIKKMPAIYSNRAQATRECQAFLLLSDKEILQRIIEETINISTMFIHGLSPFWSLGFDRSFIISLLKQPVGTGEIFRRIYSAMGLDMSNLQNPGFDLDFDFDFDPADLLPLDSLEPTPSGYELPDLYGDPSGIDDEIFKNIHMKEVVMAGSLLLGSLLDKYFFTLFGYYLKLIQPLYVLPFEFGKTMNFAAQYKNNDVAMSFYAPCSTYSLTQLGLEYFGISAQDDDFLISAEVPGHVLANVVLSRVSNKKLDSEILSEISKYYQGQHKAIYQIKTLLNQNKTYWKTIEVSSSITLHNLHLFICDEFSLDPSSDYSFYTDESMNPFVRYTPASAKGRHKKTNTITLDALELPVGSKMIYVDQNNPNNLRYDPFKPTEVKLSLEISKIKKPSGIEYYPRVSKVSKAYKNSHM